MTVPSTYSTTITQCIPGRENCSRITTSQLTSGAWLLYSALDSHCFLLQRGSLPVLQWGKETTIQMDGHRSSQVGTSHESGASIAFKGRARESTSTHWARLRGMPSSLVTSAGASSHQTHRPSWCLVGRVRRQSAGTRPSTLGPGTLTGQLGLHLLSVFSTLARRLSCLVDGGMWSSTWTPLWLSLKTLPPPPTFPLSGQRRSKEGLDLPTHG